MQKVLLTLSILTIMIFTITACNEEIRSAEKAYDLGDYQKAVELYTKAANLGDSKAQYTLGVMYAKVKVQNKTIKKPFNIV